MPDPKKFGVLILTHGRPNDVVTYESLRERGYTGPIYIVIDNEDKTADQYRTKFGNENVIMFDKEAISKTFDNGDTRTDRRTIVYARNASFEIARELGLDYFIQLDDDYTAFLYRYIRNNTLSSTNIRSLDAVFEAMVKLLDDTGALTVAMAQGGDYIGGIDGAIRKPLLRKAMNSFVCRTDRPIGFLGRMNEDVNAYVLNGMRGELMLTSTALQLNQLQTQANGGGMTDIYLASGTYMKSMYTVMMSPSCVTVKTMGRTQRRLHHQIRWNNAVPKIISDKYRKLNT
jgi:hypothetical protein